jgi:putative transferase (TIGR04331 family)
MQDYQKKCLIVSRLKEFWDVNAELIFIDESIPDFLERETLANQPYQILENIWCNLDYEKNSICFVQEKVDRYRKELTDILNHLHDVQESETYWGIILDSWLIHFLSVVHDRMNKVQFVMDRFPGVYILAADIPYDPPVDAWSINRESTGEKFNQYIYAEIATLFGMETVTVKSEIHSWHEGDERVKLGGLRGGLRKILMPMLRPLFRLLVRITRPTLIIDGYFAWKDAVFIGIRSIGRVMILSSEFLPKTVAISNIDRKMRSQLILKEEDDFDKAVNKALGSFFPKNFMEGFKANKKLAINLVKDIQVIGTAVCMHTNDLYKLLAAEVKSMGGKLLGFQHGGGYSLSEGRLVNIVEINYVNQFYFWSNTDGLGSPKLRKLNKTKVVGTNIKRKNILFASTNNKRYIYRYQIRDNSNNFLQLVNEQFKFYSELHTNLKKLFILRPHPADNGWRYKERWIDKFGDKIIFDQNRNYYTSLESTAIYVSDHLSTTWLEALYLDIPIILYFDIDRYTLVDRFKEVCFELREVGVLHDSPESAARFLNDVYGGLDEWWKTEATIVAVNRLKEFTFTESDDFVGGWVNELLKQRNDCAI